MKIGRALAIIVHLHGTIQFRVLQKLCIEHEALILFFIKLNV